MALSTKQLFASE